MALDFYATRSGIEMSSAISSLGRSGWSILECGATPDEGGVIFWAYLGRPDPPAAPESEPGTPGSGPVPSPDEAPD